MSKIYFNLAGGNLSQDWSNTGLITTNDNWSNVPSFEGFLGQDITTATGVNPGALLTDSAQANDLDVSANLTNPDQTGAPGGVGEFHITNPTIALNGSGTADAPHLIMYLNATGRQNVVVSFKARDLDGSTDNAIMPIAVQYRIGETGNWTNLPPSGGAATDSQVLDATTGPSLATLETDVTVTLPSAVNNQAQVQVRFITANAAGNDEWVGIDNINVTSDVAPQSVRFATDSLVVAKSEGDSGPTLLTFTVERLGSTEGQVDFTVNLTAAATSPANSADFTGSPAFPFAINGSILAGQSSGTFTVSVNGDTDVEVNENFTLTIASVNNATFPAIIDTNQDEATGRILADDFTGTDIGGVAVLAEAASLQGAAAVPLATNGIELVRLGSYAASGGNAEVVSFDPTTDQLYILNATGNKIEIVQIGSSGALSKTGEINLASLTEFGGANSVAVKNGIVAVAYGNVTVGDNGFVALFNASGVPQGSPIEVGVLPDMVTFTPDGKKILVANEAEAVSTGSNANGTISIIDVSAGAASATVQTTVGFTALNGSEAALDGTLGLSLFPGQSAAADIEPEYIAVAPDGTRAYVTLQEVNAVAVIDLTNPAATSPLAILPLGSVDRSLAGNQFDPSDQDGIDIGNWNVRSLLQPDSIATFTVGGETYFVTANEGDARVGTGLTGEEVRLGNASYNLDDTAFPNEATLKDNANLGRLNVINHEGDTDGDGDIDVITTFGGRGISIFKQNPDGSIEKVRETGGEFERILAQQPNANFFFNGENTFGSFDSRSDNKGPEPEGVDVGVINGRTYAFVVLERAGGVMIYDVTDPANATFVGYKPPLPPTAQPSPDNAPETVKFISAADSPTGTALIVTANEVGNATTVYAAVTPIYQIQGTGHLSAFDGQSVSTTGVVTAVDSNGFYIQDPNGDGNAATSDGVFVFTSVAPTVAVGQSIMVTGSVSEFVPPGAAPGFLSVTEIVAQNANIQVLGVGEAITPVEIGGAGHLAPPTNDIVAGALFFEKLEGMLVKVNNPVVVAPTNSNGEIFTVVDNDDNPANGINATGLNNRGVLQLTPGTPQLDDPLTTGSEALRSLNTTGGDFNPERIQIDDDSGILPGFVSPGVNPGAHLQSVTGVVSYNFANYEVLATQAYGVAQASTLAKETTNLTGTTNRLTVASYNAENLDHLDPAARFTTIASEVVNRLKSPDIIALQEIQDNDGATNSAVTAANQTLQDLVTAINAAEPAGSGIVYTFIDNPFIGDDTNGGEPGGNIRTAFLYRDDRVDLVANSLRTIGVNGVSIDTPGSPAALDQQTNVDNPFFGSRPPLVATFDFNGNEVTVVNNHFTSKGGSGAVVGSVQPPLNASEVQRAAQAQAVNNFVDSPGRQRERQGHGGGRSQRVPVGRANERAQRHRNHHQLRRAGERSVRRHRHLRAGRNGNPARPAGYASGERAIRLRIRWQRADPRPHDGHGQSCGQRAVRRRAHQCGVLRSDQRPRSAGRGLRPAAADDQLHPATTSPVGWRGGPARLADRTQSRRARRCLRRRLCQHADHVGRRQLPAWPVPGGRHRSVGHRNAQRRHGVDDRRDHQPTDRCRRHRHPQFHWCRGLDHRQSRVRPGLARVARCVLAESRGGGLGRGSVSISFGQPRLLRRCRPQSPLHQHARGGLGPRGEHAEGPHRPLRGDHRRRSEDRLGRCDHADPRVDFVAVGHRGEGLSDRTGRQRRSRRYGSAGVAAAAHHQRAHRRGCEQDHRPVAPAADSKRTAARHQAHRRRHHPFGRVEHTPRGRGRRTGRFSWPRRDSGRAISDRYARR
jgi:hypothetical protein